jgi:nitrate reductase cytochrome c-type subunit
LSALTVADVSEQQQQAQPPLIPHPVDGERAQCLVCHDIFSMIKPAPRSHADFTEDTCQTCHSLQGETP